MICCFINSVHVRNDLKKLKFVITNLTNTKYNNFMFTFLLLASCRSNTNRDLILLLHSSLYSLWYNSNMFVFAGGSVWHLQANLGCDGLQLCFGKTLMKFLPDIRDLMCGGHSIFFSISVAIVPCEANVSFSSEPLVLCYLFVYSIITSN
jgi:hypothetical protein